MNQPAPNVSPELFFETANAYQRSAALKAAIELNLFTEIGEGATAKDLAKRCQTSERGTRILLDFLVIIGFLQKDGNLYKNTADTAFFLNKKSPAYLGQAIEMLNSSTLMGGFTNLAEVVRTGVISLPEGGTTAPEHPIWETFAKSMAPLTVMAAGQMADLAGFPQNAKIKILDIAAGHGMFGIVFAQKYPAAQIYALDWQNVLKLATANAQSAGVQDRFHTIPGSAFDVDFGSDYDIVLITNFLHHFDAPTCVSFLKKVHASLKPEGKAITLEMIPNEDRISPPLAASFAMIMLGSTPSGDAYTFRELEKMHLDAGFSKASLHALPPSIQSAVVGVK